MEKDAWTVDSKHSAGQLLGYSGSRRRSSRLRQLNSDNRLRGALLLSAIFWYYFLTWYLPSPAFSTPLKRSYSRYAARFHQLLAEESSFRSFGINEAVVLATARHPGGYSSFQLPSPFNTELLHMVTSIHPGKGVSTTQEYQATSLLQLKSGEPADLSFFCIFGNVRYLAEITALQQFPLVKATTLTVECSLPPWSRSLRPGAPLEERRQVLQYIIRGSYALSLEWQSRSQPNVKGTLPLPAWTMPQSRGSLSACTTPINLSNGITAADLTEWRVHHLLQGIETVHWYANDSKLEKWVKTLSTHLGVQDSFNQAPDVAEPDIHQSAANEDLWYQDCLQRHAFNDDWLVRLSVKQYLQYEGTDTMKNTLEALPADVAELKLQKAKIGGGRSEAAPSIDGYPNFPRTAQPRYVVDKASGDDRSSIYRIKGIVSVAATGGPKLAEGFNSLDYGSTISNLTGSIKVLEAGEGLEKGSLEATYEPSEEIVELWQEEAKYLRALRKLLKLPLA